MEGNVTVDQAISRAKWLIKRGMFLILIIVIILKVIFLPVVFHKTVDIFLTIFIAIILCWLYRSLAIPIWKIWAYTNVKNVHELKLKALKNNLISIDGGFFERTEIKSYQQRETLKELEKKFLGKDVYNDDLSVAKESKIYYSKVKMSFGLGIILSLCIGIIYLIINHNLFTRMMSRSFTLVAFFALAFFFIYSYLVKLLNPNPQIMLSDKGIQIKDNYIIPWEEINNEIVYSVWRGRSYRKYLAFNHHEIMINSYNISMTELEELLHTYRSRFEKNNPK